MAQEPDSERSWTANQLVAYNLRRARELRGWKQAEAANRAAPFLGSEWSVASWSAAERSAYETAGQEGARIKRFSADEILAFSLTFELPITWFFLPPETDAEAPDFVHAEGATNGQLATTLVQTMYLTVFPELIERLGRGQTSVPKAAREQVAQIIGAALRKQLFEVAGGNALALMEAASGARAFAEVAEEVLRRTEVEVHERVREIAEAEEGERRQ